MLPTEADPARVVRGDCVATLERLPPGCAALVFADPPFNIGYGYDTYNDRRARADYIEFARRWVAACVRVLHGEGSFFLAIGDEYAAEYKLLLEASGLHFRNWIIWHYTFGPHQKKKFGRDHAHILYYTADPRRFTFNADAVMIKSARQRLGDKRANPAGRVPGDVWSFPRLPGNARERTGHPCQMPESILSRIILAASNPGELVVDPFCGSGTTVAVAKRLGRLCVTAELSEAYAARAAERAGAKLIQGD
jgi:site-specific DNA-methyltransferase (adenine-specific)